MKFEKYDLTMYQETPSGFLVPHDVSIKVDASRVTFTKSPFELKDEIKSMAGAKFDWDSRTWSIKNCSRNWFQIKYLLNENPYEWFERPLKKHVYRDHNVNGKMLSPMEHQKFMADCCLTYHYQLLGAEMGCVDGDAVVNINRAGRGFQITLKELYHKFHGGKTRGLSWNTNIPTFIRSLKGDQLGLNQVIDVLDKGVQEALRLVLESGKSIIVTPDHEIATGWTSSGVIQYVRADQLCEGNFVLSDGRWADKNGIKNDNRPENLELVANQSQHAKLHGSELTRNLNSEVRPFVPEIDKVKSISRVGKRHVYDVVCRHPHRNFVASGVVVHNCGKTLAAQMVMENSGVKDWFWVGPLKSMDNIRIEFKKWGLPDDINLHMTTFERIVKYMRNRKVGDPIPQGLIVDESSRVKGPATRRTLAIQELADMIREEYGMDGFVILMSGTPSPKSPIDWWSQCEIVWPGFLKEGSQKALLRRLSFMREVNLDDKTVMKPNGWRDDEKKCVECGEYEILPCEECSELRRPKKDCERCIRHNDEHDHRWEPSKNEVEYMYQRLDGLVRILHKKDCVKLPPKKYEADICTVSPSTMRVARALRAAATSVMQGMTWLREVSDGFLYKDKPKGMRTCNICEGKKVITQWFDPADPERGFESIDFFDDEFVATLNTREVECRQCNGSGEIPRLVREARQTSCPKDEMLVKRLKECEADTGRIVIFSAFQGSNDRIKDICHKEGWSVVRCDGRGWEVTSCEGVNLKDRVSVPLEYWADMSNKKVAFVAHPASGGLSLNLTQSRMAVFYSNDHNPESRSQAEDRVHRLGAHPTIRVKIVDIYHLPSDKRIREILADNRRLELMTMGWMDTVLEDDHV